MVTCRCTAIPRYEHQILIVWQLLVSNSIKLIPTALFVAQVEPHFSQADMLCAAQFPTYTTFFPFTASGLPDSEVLLPELLKPQGYRTGLVGKWHLGNHNKSLPTEAPGFDSFWGIPYSRDIGVVNHLPIGANNSCPSCTLWATQLKGLGVPLYRNTTIIQQPFDANTFHQNMELETLKFM